MSSLSTHVLDAVRGVPAADVPVQLFRSTQSSWAAHGTGRTDRDGRLSDFASASLTPGTYRLVFDTAVHFAATGQRGFYPEVSICFQVVEERHYHVPLLLSPYAYSTYRGS
jgi:5-hydroxyisourate hydrolase